ncbi:MAG: ABC transporter ATP-binding protein [Hyphomicrobiales bacterium]|nr:ABC transporter ATP-binding protein [Hyphomicrobiales bacterium]
MCAKAARGRALAPDVSPLFRIRGLTKVYGEGAAAVHAIRGIDLDIAAGEIVVMLGPSGSGKSTFLNIVGGLDEATSGEVFFHDRSLTDMGPRELTRFRREHVGFVFQFYNLIPSLTARENVAVVTEIAPQPMPPEEALHLVGLGERLDHFPAQLSGGEQQRVAIARAIAKRPEVLLCDEPTGALDSKTGVVVLEAIAAANAELSTTVAVITHNAAIGAMADRVVQFADGRIAAIDENRARAAPATISW